MIRIIEAQINRALARIRQPFRGLVLAANSAANIMLVQVAGMATEQLQAVEYFQHFGFTSVPPEGAQVIVLPLGGKTDQAVIVGSELGAKRVKNLASGEAALYNAFGSVVFLHAEGSISITSSISGTSLVFNADGTISVNSAGVTTLLEDLVAAGISLKNHVHPIPGGTSGAPVG